MSLSRRSVLKTGSFAAAAIATGGFGLAAAQDATPAVEQIGGSLVVYSGRNEGLVGPLLDEMQAVTGIDLKVRYAGTAELAAIILEEGDRSPADVFFGQDVGALGALAKAGALAPLPTAIIDAVDPRFRSTDGLWVGTSARARVLIYNTDTLVEADLPASVEALTDSTWSGKIGWAPTNASFQSFVTAFRLLKGEDAAKAWLEAVIANDAVIFGGNAEVVLAVAAGEISVGLVNHYYKYEIEAEQGTELPIANHYFAAGDVGSLVNAAGGGILVNAANVAQAEAFMSYLLSAPAQTYFAEQTFEYPLAAGVEPFAELVPLADLETPDIDLNDLDDLAGTIELLTDVGLI